MLEFYEWRKANSDYLQAIIRDLQVDGMQLGEVAALVADHLKTRCGVIPLGGPQYGQLFKIITVMNEEASTS